MHNLFRVRFLGFIQNCLEDLTLKIVLQLFARVLPGLESVMQSGVVGPEDKDNVKEPLREEITDMMVENHTSSSNRVFQFIQKRIFFQLVALVGLVPLTQALLFLGQLSYVDVLEIGNSLLNEMDSIRSNFDKFCAVVPEV